MHTPVIPETRPALLLTGARGQMGTAIRRCPEIALFHLLACDRGELDITDAAAVQEAVAAAAAASRPVVVVNTAAWTGVDAAETAPDAAAAINHHGAAHLAAACATHGVPLIHLSTDYVFDGSAQTPWPEDAAIAPLNVYGASKAAGEAAIRNRLERHVIVRTAWIYSLEGQNFLRTMLRLGQERPQIRVVNDQHGSPTAAPDLARVLLAIAARLATDPAAPTGTVHAAGSGQTSWYGFAQEIFRHAAAAGHPVPEVLPIPSSAYPTPARRPAFSVLDTRRLQTDWGLALPPWPQALARMLVSLSSKDKEC